ncbi:5'-nucleotidase C-terminal domain-containing protein [Pseudothermotoga thermarum]|uniref:5'-Nucleotidase domain-containing protein n=1 Tax=Pseudothermotoga thermarum DSM 5069 TaxID=688269 RepID=F7YVI3_9THEM|nr:5'-nucleotidase C-terminal domain-containing protein [Pseudothermotoga thermarum]AEH51638.1 5'-Nucleotidase domain-containing protein [Pseudothermotoga thermarum DSM 5069]
MKRLLVFLLLILVILSFAAKLTILHINDTHGRAWRFDDPNNQKIGGFAAIATIIEQVRKEVESQGGYVIFLHAGDFNTGVPESDLLDAAPDIVAFNLMKLDALVLGNHEFNKPKQQLARQMKLANFPFLSANFVDPEEIVKPEPYIIKEFPDLKVAIFGLTTEDTLVLQPIHLNGATFLSAVETSKKLVPQLREKADVVIALAHLGIVPGRYPDATTSIKLAEEVDGIDVIIDGHSHTKMEEAMVVNSTIIVQAWEWGKVVGRLDLEIEDGKIVSWSWKAIPVTSDVEEHFYVKTVLGYFKALGSEKLDTVIGETKIVLDGERANVRSKSTNLANLIADAMAWRANADVAIMNGGGIRASIKPGKISIRDVLTVLPFRNTLYVFQMKGEGLLKILEYACTVKPGQGAWPQVSGLTFKSVGGKLVEAKVKGQPIDPEKTYIVATNNYLALGGDGYVVFKQLTGYDTGLALDNVVIEYIQNVLNGIIEDYDSSQRYVYE